ncbi:acyl-CoA dehydrogenase family protein [Pleionea litopenaei]|uniref:Acyl-CoA dehydrogenase family protein n=1 Tax=Pleionea litopenaei TaxID=3070815 RepID=A0AA51RRK9_9GAMM|nr:acyl-CoA dehydrogenase family protein [Pleionea sp. HL-JVS1]WMS86179.1 acyl-CoA dehydrogenase family protein [Pleionea sp. HL-JVS1]
MSKTTTVTATEFEQLIKDVHRIGQEVVAQHAEDVDKNARFPREGIEALKSLKLMSAYVPKEHGGMGLDLRQVSKVCEVLGHYCGSTAMVYAMHKIQVACIVHHCMDVDYFKTYVGKLIDEQRLIASATTEIGIGGDLLSSFCAVEAQNGQFTLTKKAPVISYAEDANDLMLTARRNPDAAKSDQVGVLVSKDQYEVEAISDWDTLGFRGTCSSGFVVTAKASESQISPVPFTEVLSQTMHPYSHIVWAALWSGIAASAVAKARIFTKNAMRKNPNMPPISSIRLAEAETQLNMMRNNVSAAIDEYTELLERGDSDAFSNFGFTIRTNNLKINSSKLLIDIVGQAMMICGIASYRNNNDLSLARHIRDAYGASLMVNNDRIMMHNSSLVVMHKE